MEKKETPFISSGEKVGLRYFTSQYSVNILYPPGPDTALNCYYFTKNYMTIHSSSLSPTFFSSNITTGYKYVTVSNSDDFKNGGEENEFIIAQSTAGNVLFGDFIRSTPRNNVDWNNGLLRKKVVLKKGVLILFIKKKK